MSANPIPGLDILGWTYNILGKYASAESTMSCVVEDISKFENDPSSVDTQEITLKTGDTDHPYIMPQACVAQKLGGSSSHTVYGENFESYQNNLSIKVGVSGNYGAFSGSCSTEYSSSVRGQTQCSYAEVVDYYDGWAVKIDPDAIVFNSGFSADLNSTAIEAKTLFNKYGTHLVVGVVIGGSCRLTAYSTSSELETETSLEMSAKAKYNATVGSARFSVDSTYSTSKYQSALEESGELVVLGGGYAEQNALKNGDKGAWDAWAASVEDDPAVVDFMDKGLVPIWNYCTDANRKKDLETQFDALYALYNTQKDTEDFANQSDRNSTTQITWKLKEKIPASDKSLNPADFIITGIGGRIDKKEHLTRVAVEVENLKTGDRTVLVEGDVSTYKSTDYEVYASVPRGCVVTGLAVREKDKNFNNIKLYYRTINKSQSSVYLDGEQLSMVVNKGGSTTDGGGYNQDYSPKDHKDLSGGWILTGLQLNSSHGHGFNTLNVFLSQLGRPLDD